MYSSAAASLICYVLNITTVDPVSNGFIFERFMSYGRSEFPDVDSMNKLIRIFIYVKTNLIVH